MVFIGPMRNHHDNDNEELGFITLSALTANVMQFLKLAENHHEDRERDTRRDRTEEQKAEDKREAIDQRLRDLATFERRANGGK